METVVIGGVVAFSGLCMAIYNEVSYPKQKKFLENLRKNVKVVKNVKGLKAIRDGNPVMVSDEVFLKDELKDHNLNIHFPYPKVYRNVLMYQMKENEEQNSDNNKNNSGYIWSSIFQKGKDNPHFPFKSCYFIANEIRCGPFSFNKKFIDRNFQIDKKLVLTQEICESIPLPWLYAQQNKTNYMQTSHSYWAGKYKGLENGNLYIKSQKQSVGDLFISYQISESNYLTVLGAKKGNKIKPYRDEGNSVYFVKNKNMTTKEVCDELNNECYQHYIVNCVISALLFTVGIGTAIYGLHFNSKKRRN